MTSAEITYGSTFQKEHNLAFFLTDFVIAIIHNPGKTGVLVSRPYLCRRKSSGLLEVRDVQKYRLNLRAIGKTTANLPVAG